MNVRVYTTRTGRFYRVPFSKINRAIEILCRKGECYSIDFFYEGRLFEYWNHGYAGESICELEFNFAPTLFLVAFYGPPCRRKRIMMEEAK